MEKLKAYCFFIKATPKNMGEVRETIKVYAENESKARVLAMRNFSFNNIVSMKRITE